MSGAVALLLPETIELCNAMMAGHALAGMPGAEGVTWSMPPPTASVPFAALFVMVLFCTLTVVETIAKLRMNMPPPAAPDPRLLGDFFVPATVTLGPLAEIYGLPVDAADAATSLADHFAANLSGPVHAGDRLSLGAVALIAHAVADGRVATVGLQLAEPEPPAPRPRGPLRRLRIALRRLRSIFRRKPART